METQTTQTTKRVKLFYIGERINPQLSKSYYKAYGQLSKKDAVKKSDCSYGGMYLTSYATEAEYKQSLENLKTLGFNIY